MATHKRISKDYNITTVDDTGTITLTSSAVNITGNLVVAGTTTTVNSTDTEL